MSATNPVKRSWLGPMTWDAWVVGGVIVALSIGLIGLAIYVVVQVITTGALQ